MEEIIRLFPDHFQILLKRKVNWKTAQEIRLRINRKIEVLDARQTAVIEGPLVTSVDLSYVLNQISQFSLYRFKDELKEGFITIQGGHRVGMAGKANTVNNRIETLKHIAFMNIRVAKNTVGQVNQLIPYLYQDGRWASTLIIGPPHSGKTTLLRELAQRIGSDYQNQHACKVAIVDERSEIAASLRGIPQLEVGERTDVMDACPKAEGMMMMIRSMSPEVMIVDEIGGIADANAIREATFTGVEVICSIHGTSLTNVKKRPSAKELIEEGVFERYLVLERLSPNNAGSVSILDECGLPIAHWKGRELNGVDRGRTHIDCNYIGRF
ncbi:stage III sporulation protein AA [Halobacillus sp. K22]|uniref:stage III sporulation protein AA n=1 Tax=Halobacillus sp. K22 TaxID=3457431 RepID=UPI003FCC5C97